MTIKERPILFSAPMVRAIIDGMKTQTRRIVKPQPPSYIDELHGNDLRGRAPYRLDDNETGAVLGSGFQDDNDVFYKCPYGIPGDRLWVRECWGLFDTQPSDGPERAYVYYRATDGDDRDLRYQLWRPSIHMPRWASRITLEVVGVRVERVQDISEADAEAEGFERTFAADGSEYGAGLTTATEAFAALWSKITGPASWSENPWVWVVEFRRIEARQ